MVCLACRRHTQGRLCRDCGRQLRPAPDHLLEGGLRVRSAFIHWGPARKLVHNLKYRGIEAAGRVLAEAMADLVPADSTLVPIPRVISRNLRHGIDPAATLACHLVRITGSQSCDLLLPPFFGRSQAKSSRDHRNAPTFKSAEAPRGPVVLVDDVVTTGGTALSAWRALGRIPGLVVSATSGIVSPGNRD